jgi:hypothetical protein
MKDEVVVVMEEDGKGATSSARAQVEARFDLTWYLSCRVESRGGAKNLHALQLVYISQKCSFQPNNDENHETMGALGGSPGG